MPSNTRIKLLPSFSQRDNGGLVKGKCRLVLRNEAQHDTVCWASQAQHQPTPELLRQPAREREFKIQNIEKQGGWQIKTAVLKPTPPLFRCFVGVLPC